MKNIVLFTVFILGGLLFNSCGSDEISCIRASSNIISENRDEIGFKGVVFNQVGDLKLTQGADYSIKLTGPENVVSLTTTRIENDLLIINSDDCFNGSYDLLVEITSPDYKEISMVGVGDVKSVGKIAGQTIELNLQGVGDFDVEIEAESLYTTLSGTGSMKCTGTVTMHKFIGAGKFTLNGYGLATDHTEMTISGTGDSYVQANNTLKVSIGGTGDVYYKGNPTITENITGVGEVIDAN